MKGFSVPNNLLDNKTILITGGTGSFGKAFVRRALKNFRPKKIVIYSRDELKQYEMAKIFPTEKYPCIRYFIGDVRDSNRINRALRGVDIVVHAAALKHVAAAEYNPFEFVKTNIIGSQNLIDACIERGVQKVIALSTDKAATPINLYGATKLCAEKLFVAGNSMSGDVGTRFAVVRYGNVVGSRGSVIPFFLSMKKNKTLPITDERMTRFWISLEQALDLVFTALETTQGGEIYIPKIPSMRIMDLAAAIAPECKLELVGIRPGEKLHESMIGIDEAPYTREFDGYYAIQPAIHNWYRDPKRLAGGKAVANQFSYTSDKNDRWLTHAELMKELDNYVVNGPELLLKAHLDEVPSHDLSQGQDVKVFNAQ